MSAPPSASVAGAPAVERLEFETLISDVSAQLLAAAPDEVDTAILAALTRVRSFFHADRFGLLAVSPDGQFANVLHESDADGVSSVSGELNLAALFPWCRQKLVVERVAAIVHRMDDLPPEAAVDRDSWNRYAPTRSNLAVPVQFQRQVTHAVVVHWVHEECLFPDVYVPRLRLLGEVCVNALQRKHDWRALRTSEERLARAAAAAACGLWDFDAETGLIWATPEARGLYDVDPDAPLTYAQFVGVLHPDHRDSVTASIAATLETGVPYDQTYRILLRDGALKWVHAVGRRDGPSRLLGASIDVTTRVLADQRAREQAARVAAAVEVAGLGFTEWEVGGGAPYVDERLRELFAIGPEDEERVQEVWLARVHDDDRSPLEQARQRLLAGEVDSLAIEYRYEHPQRGCLWIRHISRAMELAGPPARRRLIGAVQDITAQRTREEELRRLRDQLENENLYLRQETARHSAVPALVGRSGAITRALTLAHQVAPTNATVLITGETGTGKERFATLIHEASPRRSQTMVRVNCSAIPTALIESELFGREKGAYTGALSRQVGRFEVANGSTLFLDEVCDLPLDVQVKLLRVLQEHTIERLGSPRPITVDVRIVAATNRNLEEAVREGRFRSDLFYRLNVFPIQVPPLRDRREDIPLLVAELVDEIGAAMGKRFESVSKASVDALQRYDWPGNVRELRNVLERAMILESGPVLRVALDAPSAAPVPVASGAAAERLQDVERQHIVRVLTETGWRIKGPDSASVRLGMKPSTLYFRMKKLGIERPAR